MFRYELLPPDTAHDLQFDGVLKEGLVEAGYTSAGRYRAAYQGQEAFAGEIFVDPTGTIAASVNQHQRALNASLHTVLSDGTYVITEMLPPRSEPMVAGLSLPVPGTRMRFPKVTTVAGLRDAHARHVAEVAEELGTAPAAGMDAAGYIALRHGEQRKRMPLRAFQESVARWVMLGGVLAASLFALFAALLHLPLAVSIGGLAAGILGSLAFTRRLAFNRVAPWLARHGRGPSWETLTPASASASAGDVLTVGPVELRDPGAGSVVFAAMPIVAVLVSLAGYVSSILAGGKASAWSWLPLAIMAMNNTLADVVTNRRAFRKKAAKLTVDRDEVRGPRAPVPRARIAGAVVGAERGGDPTFFAVDANGRVVLRASGTPEDLAALERTLAPKRQRLPLAGPYGLGLFAAGAATFATAMALYLSGVRSDLWIAALGAGVVTAPIFGLMRRRSIEIGADGLSFASPRRKSSFVAWNAIAALAAKGEQMTITLKDGTVQKPRGALPGTAAQVVAAWTAHGEREAARDDAKAARRRVADTATGAYRVAEDDADALVETVLDSTEDQSVRVRAARKLALHEDASARADAAAKVADPAVKRELSSDDDP